VNQNVPFVCIARELLSGRVRERDGRDRDRMEQRRLDGSFVAGRSVVEDDDRAGAGRDGVLDLDEEKAAAAADERDGTALEVVEVGALEPLVCESASTGCARASTSPLPE
jgi:hypothetical protein